MRAFSARLGSREAAEDLVQELWCRLETAAPSAPVERPSAYLFRLALNLMLDRRRGERRARRRDGAWRRETTVSAGEEVVAPEPAAEEAVDARRRLKRLLALVEDLPPQTRRAFHLHKLDGLSHAETARVMGISRSGVEKHIMAALKQLVGRLG